MLTDADKEAAKRIAETLVTLSLMDEYDFDECGILGNAAYYLRESLKVIESKVTP